MTTGRRAHGVARKAIGGDPRLDAGRTAPRAREVLGTRDAARSAGAMRDMAWRALRNILLLVIAAELVAISMGVGA